MMDSISEENSKIKDAVVGATFSNHQILNVHVTNHRLAETSQSSICVKQEEKKDEMAANLQHAARWIRDVVDPTFTVQIKPEDNDKEVRSLLLYHGFQGTYDQHGSLDCKEEKVEVTLEVPASDTAQTQAPALYYCETCKRKFSRQSNLTEHMMRHLGKSYACNICHKKFSCVRYLTRHSRIHTDGTVKKVEQKRKVKDKNYICNYCNKSFSCKSHLDAHTRLHTGLKPFTCQYCSKSFNHKSHLNTHIRLHTGERPFQCRICEKNFRDPSNLAGHMRVHNNQKPFACVTCNEQFTHRSHLKKHEKTHLGVKLHDCNYCPKQFVENAKLKQHLKTHEKLTCNVCNNEFVKRQDKSLICDNCTKQFSQRVHLRVNERVNENFLIYAAVGEQ